MIHTLAHAPNSRTMLFDLADAAESAGLTVRRIAADRQGWFDGAALSDAAGDGVAYRCAGGPLAAAIQAGAPIQLAGATARWFTDLPTEVTGRRWALTDLRGARDRVSDTAAFVKLAEAKFGSLPARRYASLADLDAAMAAVHAPDSLDLLVTHGWLDIDSEYRVFTRGRDVLAWSPYLVHDDPWTPLLRTHRASFHDEAAAFVAGLLAALADDDVPPTAVLDVARLADRRFVVLEVNHVWAAGLYGCDPADVLGAVVAAADQAESDPRWRWSPDPAVAELHR